MFGKIFLIHFLFICYYWHPDSEIVTYNAQFEIYMLYIQGKRGGLLIETKKNKIEVQLIFFIKGENRIDLAFSQWKYVESLQFDSIRE